MKAFDRRMEPKSRAQIFRGLPIRNDTGSTITAGQMVYVSSWSETYKRFQVTLADANAAGRTRAQYIVRNQITDGQNGVGWKTYRLQTVDTSAASAVGDPVYLSGTAGGWTLTAPSASNGVDQVVGRVAVDSASVGEIEFNLELDEGEKTARILVHSESSQTTERNVLNIQETQDSTFLTGTNITYSGARGSAALKIQSTVTMASGGFSNIYSNINTSGAFSSDGNGIVGVKAVVTNTAAMTDGEMYGAQFIAKHAHASNVMTAQASLIGIEAWAYNSAAGPARTQIGGNFGWHNEATGGTYGAGSVIRGIQVFCDNNAGGNDPVESTGIALWNQTGTITNAINVVESGSGFTNFATFTDGVCANLTNGSTLNDISATANEGWIKVTVGSTVRYIALYAAKA